jgi:hypothetical protein
VDGFLLEAMTDAYHVQKIPILALKRTLRGEFVMYPRYLGLKAVELGLPPPESYPYLSYIYKRPEENIPVHHLWTLVSFDFFIHNTGIFWEAGTALLTEEGEQEECSEQT